MKTNKFLVIVLIFLNIEGAYSEKCGADKLKIKPRQLDLESQNKKKPCKF